MAEFIEGRNGGKLKKLSKGEQANEGAGRPKGTLNAKTIYKKLLSEEMPITINGKEHRLPKQMVLQMRQIELAMSENDIDKLNRTLNMIFDRTDGKPVQSVVSTETTSKKFEAWMSGDEDWEKAGSEDDNSEQ